MSNRFTAAVLLVLAGCASNAGTPGAAQLLAGAHESLAANDTDGARQWLDSAAPVLDTSRDRKEYALLTAAVEIRSGRADDAVASMDQLLTAYPQDPRVHEMAGKARLMIGDFDVAERHFDAAMDAYRDEADAGRAADLLALARGLEAYAGGRVAAAGEHWEGIRDAGLRASVFNASGAVSPGPGPALARSNQPLQ